MRVPVAHKFFMTDRFAYFLLGLGCTCLLVVLSAFFSPQKRMYPEVLVDHHAAHYVISNQSTGATKLVWNDDGSEVR